MYHKSNLSGEVTNRTASKCERGLPLHGLAGQIRSLERGFGRQAPLLSTLPLPHGRPQPCEVFLHFHFVPDQTIITNWLFLCSSKCFSPKSCLPNGPESKGMCYLATIWSSRFRKEVIKRSQKQTHLRTSLKGQQATSTNLPG